MFQNHASMFPYPFIPSLNNSLNFLQQAPSTRSSVSTVSGRKSTLTTPTSSSRNEMGFNKLPEKQTSCDSSSKISLTKPNPETASSLKYAGSLVPSFWPQVQLEGATQDLKRKYLSHEIGDIKALDLSKASCNKKTRRSQGNSRPNYDISDNDTNALYPYHQSVFSEFLRSPFMPKLTSVLDDKKDEDYCKSFNGNEPIKRSLYGNHPNHSSPNFSKCQASFGKTCSTGPAGDMGWMTNDLLLQPPLLPTLTFLKWSPEELAEYVGNVDGCTETAEALRLHGISGSRLPMLTLDSMTQELGLSMSSAQSLMNIVRNLLSVTIPGEAL